MSARPDPKAQIEPTVELVLLRVMAEAHIATMPRRRAERFLRAVAEKLAEEENLSAVFPIRPTSWHAKYRGASRLAAEAYKRWLPTLLARLQDN